MKPIKIFLKLTIVLAIIGLVMTDATAQDSYKSGYMVTFSGDTIQGFINRSNAKQSAKYCLFKKELDAVPVKYFPFDLKSYKVGDSRFYQARSINRNGQFVDFFLECLVDGIIDLYYLADAFKDHLYIEKEGTLYELDNDMVSIESGGKRYRANSNNYKTTLKVLMADAPALYEVINESEFDHTDLINLNQTYHHIVCPDQECIIYSRDDGKLNDGRLKVRIGLAAGISFASLNLHGSLLQQIEYQLTNGLHTTYPPLELLYEVSLFDGWQSDLTLSSTCLMPVGSVNFAWGWNQSIQVDFSYQHHIFHYNQTELTRKNLEFNAIYRKDFFFYKKFSPYLTAGLAINTSINNDLTNLTLSYGIPTLLPNTDEVSYRPVNSVINSISLEGRNTDPGVMFGMGIRYNLRETLQLNLELRHDRSKYHIKSVLDDQLRVRFENSIISWQLLVGASL